MKRLLTLLFCWLVGWTAQGQFIHYTQYDMVPLSLNPAHTGAFYGTFRIGGLYRDQFFQTTGFEGGFTTPCIYIDAPIIKGFRDKDWIGVGVNMFQDKAGTLEMTTASFMGSAAYHLGLGKAGNSTLTFGVQLGSTSRSLATPQLARWGDNSPESLGDNEQAGFFDMGLGVMYRSLISNNSLIEVGASLFHLTAPDYFIKGNGSIPRRIVVHGRLKQYLTEELTLTPSVMFTRQGARGTFVIQSVAGLMLNKKKQLEVNAGLGLRASSLASLQVLAGVNWGDFKAGLGYDIGLSSAAFEGMQPGSIELAASYIVKIYRKPNPKPTIFCPRF